MENVQAVTHSWMPQGAENKQNIESCTRGWGCGNWAIADLGLVPFQPSPAINHMWWVLLLTTEGRAGDHCTFHSPCPPPLYDCHWWLSPTSHCVGCSPEIWIVIVLCFLILSGLVPSNRPLLKMVPAFCTERWTAKEWIYSQSPLPMWSSHFQSNPWSGCKVCKMLWASPMAMSAGLLCVYLQGCLWVQLPSPGSPLE
jgi:hypothetical protein